MRNKVGTALSLIGGFLILVALMGFFYAPGPLMKTPLDVDKTTSLEGEGEIGGETSGVKAWSVTYTDSEKSDDEVAVWVNSSCLVKDEGEIEECVSETDPDDRLLSASTDNYATDRVTALAVNDPKYLPAEAIPHFGLINKWPFEAKKTTYPYWDTVMKAEVEAVYDRTEKVMGLETYVYTVTVDGAPIEIVAGVPGTYDDNKEIFVEPLTGSIVDQRDSQVRYGEDGEPALSLSLAFTEEQVKDNVEEADSSASSLNLVTKIVPLVGLIVGIPLAIVGTFLLLMGRRRQEPVADEA